MRVVMTVDGLDELKEAMERVKDKLNELEQEIIKADMVRVQVQAKMNQPSDEEVTK